MAAFAHSTPAPAPLYPWPASIPTPSRREIEEMIEGLIAYLGAQDGDPDQEQDEPDAAAREWCGSGAHRFVVGAAA